MKMTFSELLTGGVAWFAVVCFMGLLAALGQWSTQKVRQLILPKNRST
ncbi:hypothetical protein ACQZV8_03060 [Magnetococcales bacterium HHB-1]